MHGTLVTVALDLYPVMIEVEPPLNSDDREWIEVAGRRFSSLKTS
jgi:hypothetical protein